MLLCILSLLCGTLYGVQVRREYNYGRQDDLRENLIGSFVLLVMVSLMWWFFAACSNGDDNRPLIIIARATVCFLVGHLALAEIAHRCLCLPRMQSFFYARSQRKMALYKRQIKEAEQERAMRQQRIWELREERSRQDRGDFYYRAVSHHYDGLIEKEDHQIHKMQRRITRLEYRLKDLYRRRYPLAGHQQGHEAKSIKQESAEAKPMNKKSAPELMREAERHAARHEFVAALSLYDSALQTTRELGEEIARKRESLGQQLPLR